MKKNSQYLKVRVLQLLSNSSSPLDSTQIFTRLHNDGILITKASLMVTIRRWEQEELITRSAEPTRTRLAKKLISLTPKGWQLVEGIAKSKFISPEDALEDTKSLNTLIANWIRMLGWQDQLSQGQVDLFTKKILEWHYEH